MILTDEKALVVLICFAAAGLVFMVCGFYFMSEGFLNSLRESREDEESRRLAEYSGRLCGQVATGIGALTIFCGIMTKMFPQIFHFLALFYVIALMIGFMVISFTMRKG